MHFFGVCVVDTPLLRDEIHAIIVYLASYPGFPHTFRRGKPGILSHVSDVGVDARVDTT